MQKIILLLTTLIYDQNNHIKTGIDKLILLCYDDTGLHNKELNDVVTLSEIINIVDVFLEKM